MSGATSLERLRGTAWALWPVHGLFIPYVENPGVVKRWLRPQPAPEVQRTKGPPDRPWDKHLPAPERMPSALEIALRKKFPSITTGGQGGIDCPAPKEAA